jgi:hypothetical protein
MLRDPPLRLSYKGSDFDFLTSSLDSKIDNLKRAQLHNEDELIIADKAIDLIKNYDYFIDKVSASTSSSTYSRITYTFG